MNYTKLSKAIQLEAELPQKEGHVELEIPQREGFKLEKCRL